MLPQPTPLFVGRTTELERVRQMLERVPAAVITGVAGIGKSALAYAVAAGWRGRVAYHKVGADESMAAVIDAARRQLAAGRVAAVASDGERLLDLVRRLDSDGALLLVDDLHALPRSDDERLVTSLAALLRRGRLLATSREQLDRSAGAADYFDLRLAGLDRAAARALWAGLDQLYGASAGFDAVAAGTGGNPFLLRRAHAGGLADEHPIRALLCALAAPERRLVGALALSETPLSRAVLHRLGGGPVDERALLALVRALIVDVDATGTASLHDLFREAMRLELSAGERDDLHAALAAAADAIEAPVLRARAVARHLGAIGRYAEAGRALLAAAPELVRHGAAAELLHGLDAIPAELRSHDMELARARTMVRLLELERAHETLERLVAADADAPAELRLAYGAVAMLTARLDDGERMLRRVLDGALDATTRVRAQTAFALCRTYRGAGDEARAFLERASDELGGPPPLQGGLLFARAFTLAVDGADPATIEPLMRRSLALLGSGAGLHAEVLAPIFYATVRAQLGQLEGGDEWFAAVSGGRACDEDPRLRLDLDEQRAIITHLRGGRLAALAASEAVAERSARAGYVIAVLTVRARIGQLLLELGRRRAGLALLDGVAREAARRGVHFVERAVERARDADPLRLVGAPPGPLPPRAKAAEWVRQRAQTAVAAALVGDAARVRAIVEEVAPFVDAADFALDRVALALCDAWLARLDDDARAEDRAVAAAQAIAAASDIDHDLVAAVADAAGRLRLITPTARRLLAAAPADLDDRHDPILDARSHELRSGGRRTSLSRRPIVRRLVYVLATRPGAPLGKEELVARVWGASYHPLVHDNALKVNISHARTLLAPAGVRVAFEEPGYRLVVPARFAFVAPVGGDALASAR